MKRRTFVATTAGLGTALLAGCSGDSDTGDGSGSGTFRLLISDQPAAIGDFDSLEVTLSSARVFRADEDDTSGTPTETPAESPEPTTESTEDGTAETDEDDEDGETEGFVEFDLDSPTIDLTQVVGDRAIPVLEGELEAGRYSGIELRVASAEGVVDGETVGVKVPSNRLRIVKPFEVTADEELSFVFDINVVQKGPRGDYNLLPVIGKSGVAGEDVDVEEVDSDVEAETGTPDTTETAQ
ncbi:DUF4382 domain-containing protein [Salinibaculum rarum]|uniref:DUF4382 domain-containing protein n=1 Tax=Salinibaculum rarum TaxID=3058903 RepID=UPI0026605835|nr:DUF4382 domain-containing protein [Salinibaculum sp. KK48]